MNSHSVNHQPLSSASHIWLPWASTILVCGLATALGVPLLRWVAPTNIAMLFLLVVLAVSVWWGRGAAILSAVLLVAGFDFFLVEPHLTFAVGDAQYLITFAVMLVVGLSISYLVSQLRHKQQLATQQATQMTALYQLSKNLIQATDAAAVARATSAFVQAHLGFDTDLLCADDDETHLTTVVDAPHLRMVEQVAAQGLFDQGKNHPSTVQDEAYFEDEGQSTMYVLLQGMERVRGVMLVRAQGQSFATMRAARPMIDAVASMVAMAVERLRTMRVAETRQWETQSERLRGSILAALSHDIRTPLTAIYGAADRLRYTQPAPSAEVVEIADRLCAQALQLNQMVSNLLSFSQLQSGQVELQRDWIPVEELVGSSLHSLMQPLQDVDVKVDVPELLLWVDAVLFERVLANLIDNAVKYNHPQPAHDAHNGQRWLKIEAHEVEGTAEIHPSCTIRITNPTEPLTQAQIAAMFDLFERLGSERTELGAGLGLSICRAIVQAHEGEIWATQSDKDGQNTLTVCVRVPLRPAPTWDEVSEVSP